MKPRSRIIRQRRQRGVSPLMLLLLETTTVLCCLLFFTLIHPVHGFTNELFTQAVEAVNAVQVLDDAFLFAAVNLFVDDYYAPSSPNLLLKHAPPPPLAPSFSFPNAIVMPQQKQQQPTDSSSPTPIVPWFVYDYEIPPLATSLVLTAQEQALFDLLCQVRNQKCPATTLRVAGGWVRDKLLGRTESSYDIDVVLSHCTGRQFAQYVQDYLLEHQQQANDTATSIHKRTLFPPLLSNISIQACTASTSTQHLQTARLQIGLLDVDLAQLRHEVGYSGRVPDLARGQTSVVQDAWRRDLTVNSLYYNLHSGKIEDWTEQGLSDLKFGILRTPAAPLTTLMEDPLRWLRAVRMAAQLPAWFRLDDALMRAGGDPKVARALSQKVSRTRMGKEIHGVFCASANPVAGLRHLTPTFLSILFGPAFVSSSYRASLTLLARTQALASRIWPPNANWKADHRTYLWYAAWFYHATTASWATAESEAFPRGISRRRRCHNSVVYQSLTQKLARPAQDSQTIDCVIQGACSWKEETLPVDFMDPAKDTAAVLNDDRLADLRWQYYQTLKQVGPLWRESLVLMLANNDNSSMPLGVDAAVQQYERWVSFLEDTLGLTDDMIFQKRKPLLCGSEIQNLLPGVQGRQFRQVTEALEEWRVRQGIVNGGVLDKEQAMDFLKHKFAEYALHTQ